MSWRSLIISNPARLRSEHQSLVIEQEESVAVPLEDIAVIVLNHHTISLTHSVLTHCAEQGIALYSLGDNHQPNGVHLPFLQHSRTVKVQRLQLAATRPQKKRLWAQIVSKKIFNQAQALLLHANQADQHLLSLSRRVRSGDPDNLESQASAHYFSRMFDPKFRRRDSIWVNSALNYGYSILRGAIARALVAHGLIPSIGIFHRSEQNAFNLADDMIEPFRPLVDLHVAHCSANKADNDSLETDDKAQLVALLNVDWQLGKEKTSTLSAITRLVVSLVNALESNVRRDLEVPILCGLSQHQVEGGLP